MDLNNNQLNIPSEKNGREFSWIKLIIITFIISAITGYSFGFLGYQISKKTPPASDKNKISKETTGTMNTTEEEQAVVAAVEKNSPAVVSIIITKEVSASRDSFPFFDFFDDPFFNPFGAGEDSGDTRRQEIGGGSGFIVSADGYIITNKHVISDKNAQYTVMLNDGTELEAQVLAQNPSIDVAVLKISSQNELPFVELGDSSTLKIGQTVIAIGNSLGEFRNTVSKGIISGLKRQVVAGDGFGQSETLGDVIQTDAAINPGNSGGPLIDISGKVIGVNVAVAQGAENIGFALPINQVKRTLEQVRSGEEITVPFLGVRYVQINKELKKTNSLPFDYGILVLRGESNTELAVIPGSPADKAGIVENDIILEIDGKKLTTDNNLSQIISSHEVGDQVKIKVWHKGEEKEVTVTLEKRPSE